MLWDRADNLHVTLHQYSSISSNTAHLKDRRELRDISITIEGDRFSFNGIDEFLTAYGYRNHTDIYGRLFHLFLICFPEAFKNFLHRVRIISDERVVRTTPMRNRRASDVIFKEKYIKYKNKYLKLKKMLENNN